MSMFKKPKRNIRRREIEIQDDDSDVKEIEVVKTEHIKNEQNGDSTGIKAIKQTLLSFGQEWDEGDDGEVFQVKKSSQSKKIRRQIEREKEEKRKKDSCKTEKNEENTKTRSKDKIIATEEVTIKIKNPIAGPVVQERILSGLSAEMAGYRSDSETEDGEIIEDEGVKLNIPRHKFTQPDHVKMLLKSGQIPDAALIHAARKRRQQVREMGGASYIPIEDDISVTKIEPENKSRLIREDDNDGSDEEERISMSGIVSYTADREKRKEGLDTIITSDAEDEDNNEVDEWENQQIRKAVTEAQVAAVQQESYYIQYMNNAAAVAASSIPSMPLAMTLPSSDISNSCPASVENTAIFPPLPAENATESVDPETIAKKLKDRMQNLEETHKRRENNFKNITNEIISLKADQEKRKIVVPGLAERFQFYQDLRGYVTDLVECLDEKIPLINSLEQRLINMYQKKATELITRRRQDIKDQMEELTPTKNLIGIKKDEERTRRTAEREGRRIRRLKNRNLSATSVHLDGMSSDDEITEMASIAYRNQKEIIESDASKVFEDVVEEFISIDDILKRFSDWRKLDQTAYVEAYANMCLPKLLGPIIRMNMLMWNPLIKNQNYHLDNLSWIKSIIMYSAEKSDTEETLRKDPDLQFLPNLIDKVVIPKLEQIVKVQWDPLSIKETDQLTTVIKSILEYPFIAPNSKFFSKLIDSIIDKMKQAVENDVFIPMFPKQLLDSGKLNVFFQKQFTTSVKLYSNLLKWYEIINGKILAEIANSSLLNRYLLMAIRTLQPLEAATKCQIVASYLPKSWLKEEGNESDLYLSPFFNCIKQLILQIDSSNPHGKDAIEKLNEIIKYV